MRHSMKEVKVWLAIIVFGLFVGLCYYPVKYVLDVVWVYVKHWGNEI